MARTSRIVEISVRVYAMLILVYPSTFRREYGNEMTKVFREMATDAWRKRRSIGMSCLWCQVLVDLLSSVATEHLLSLKSFLYDCLQACTFQRRDTMSGNRHLTLPDKSMDSQSSSDLDLVALVESLDRRVRILEMFLGLLLTSAFIGIGVLAARTFSQIPNLTAIESCLGGLAATILLIVLYWNRSFSNLLLRKGVPKWWCAKLVGALGAVALVYLIPTIAV